MATSKTSEIRIKNPPAGMHDAVNTHAKHEIRSIPNMAAVLIQEALDKRAEDEAQQEAA